MVGSWSLKKRNGPLSPLFVTSPQFYHSRPLSLLSVVVVSLPEPCLLFITHIAGNGIDINWLAQGVHTGKTARQKIKIL
ncbi:hypothetical protein JNE112863_42190 [Escherichia coli]